MRRLFCKWFHQKHWKVTNTYYTGWAERQSDYSCSKCNEKWTTNPYSGWL